MKKIILVLLLLSFFNSSAKVLAANFEDNFFGPVENQIKDIVNQAANSGQEVTEIKEVTTSGNASVNINGNFVNVSANSGSNMTTDSAEVKTEPASASAKIIIIKNGSSSSPLSQPSTVIKRDFFFSSLSDILQKILGWLRF